MTRNTELQDLLYFKGISNITSIELNDLSNADNFFDYDIVISVQK